MRSLRDAVDRRYLKVAAYGVCAALVTLLAGLLLYHSGGFWKVLLEVVGAILRPLCIGLLIAYLLSPLVGLVERHLPFRSRVVRHDLAVAVTVLLVLAAVVLLMFATLSALLKQIQEVRLDDLQYVYTELTNRYQAFAEMAVEQLGKAGISMDSVTSRVAKMLSGAPEALSTTVFSVIFAVYFLIDGENIGAYWKRAFHVLVGERGRAVAGRMVGEAQEVFSGYLRGQFLDAVLVGIEASVVLTVAGVPYGAMIGILTGLGNLIPYLTGFVGYGTLIVSCLAAGDLHKLVVGGVCLAVVLVVDSNVVNPKLLGTTIKVHPLLVIASLIAGGTIGGILGMLVAVPVGAFVKLQFDHYLDARAAARAAEGDVGGEAGDAADGPAAAAAPDAAGEA